MTDIRTTYQVEGMTCGHCIAAVTTEVKSVPGVSDVSVDITTGRVIVTSTRPLERAEVAAAVDEAGYELAS